MIYLYALCDRGGMDPTSASGLEEAPLRAVGHDDIAAVVSDHHSLDLAPKEASLWAHERVSEALMHDTSVLPVRFGVTYAHDELLRHALAEHSGAIRAALSRVSGCVEVGVRVMMPEAQPADDDEAPAWPRDGEVSGRQYLMARLQKERLGRSAREGIEAFAGELQDRLGPLARDRVASLRSDARMPLSAAYLVEQAALPSFMERVDALRSERDDIDLLVTGPWPPYSFVDLDLATAAGSVS